MDAKDDDHEGVDGCGESRREVAFPSLQLPFVMVGRDARLLRADRNHTSL